ncbi:Cyclin-U4 [Seminavis robusta]|uniref:Cyclin-U4 n=1 Tax=Seminavis robusta TaxID=568900 RepID=A0A9N8HPM0_9STRA|nr:Cyclin-U4 [Seminavis robusta]|eukprot:Sro912_g219320.1 Cyclin-U4 (426) ;mRNA; r:24061-25427
MESTPEEAAEGLAIVRVLAAVLDRLVCANSPLARTEPGQITKFHALKAPGIGIQQYLERIHKYASCSSQCFIMALIYIDRLIQRNGFLLTELNVHRVTVTAILLAAKFFDDAYYNNAYYAKVGGVLVAEMNGLEVDFLFRINFSLHVSPELFEQYRVELLSHSGVDSLPLPPPSPHYGMEQCMTPATIPQQQQLHDGIHNQSLQLQAVAAAASICNPGMMGYNTIPAQQQPLTHIPSHVTPSPTRGTALSGAAGMVAAAPQAKTPEEAIMVAVDQQINAANLSNMLTQQEFAFLQRANSLPLQPQSIMPVTTHPQPLSAPMMSMVPGALNPGFPSLVDAAAVAAAVSSDPMVVMDNPLYHVQNLHHHQHHHVASNQRRVMDASDLIHHVHHHPSHRHVPGFVSREASVAQRFAAGQMVAGVSGGL